LTISSLIFDSRAAIFLRNVLDAESQIIANHHREGAHRSFSKPLNRRPVFRYRHSFPNRRHLCGVGELQLHFTQKLLRLDSYRSHAPGGSVSRTQRTFESAQHWHVFDTEDIVLFVASSHKNRTGTGYSKYPVRSMLRVTTGVNRSICSGEFGMSSDIGSVGLSKGRR
jgi:hypothetical protein